MNRWYINNSIARSGQAAIDNAMPEDMLDIDGNEPACKKCGTREWRLWQRGSVDGAIFECCYCGNKQQED